jgi:type I restriction enzyme, S subunit
VSDLPAGWEWTTLEEITEVRLGRQRSPKNHSGTNMRPYLRAANVTWHGLDLTDVKEMNFTPEEVEVYRLRRGDIVLAEASGSAGEVGKPALWNDEMDDCCFQNTLLRVRSMGPLPQFLVHLFRYQAATGQFGDAARGVGIHHLGAQRLSEWPVGVPPIEEQHRIVSAIEEQLTRLDDAEASLLRCEKRLAVMQRAVYEAAVQGPWPRVPLSDVTARQEYGSSAKATANGSGVPIIRMGNIQDGHIEPVNLKFLPAGHPDTERFRLVRGDLLFNRTNSPDLVGKSAVFAGQPSAACFASYLIRVQFNDRCLPAWAAAVLNSPYGRRWASRVRTQQVGQANINGTKLAAMEMPLPPREEQARLVGDLEQQLSVLDAMENAIDQARMRSEALKRSILERAFTGRLVPQDSADEPASVLLERIRAERAAAPQPRRGGRRRASTSST